MVPDAAARAEVARNFILGTHMAAIERAASKGNFAISFRAAGAATLRALQKGAAAKGHDILEKTIKESSIANIYSRDKARLVIAAVRAAGIEGYVGHWDANNLLGVYLSTEAGGHEIHRIDVDNLPTSLIALKLNPHWQKLAFSGDYDAHDIITFRGAGRPRTVLAQSDEERGIIDLINSEIARVDVNRPVGMKHHNVMRHGPQVNYLSYMISFEPDKVVRDGGVSGAVARPGTFPLAAVRNNTWTIIASIEQLAHYYKSLGAVIKESWRPGGERLFVDNPKQHGIVTLGRKCC